jgi:hypothetical protein
VVLTGILIASSIGGFVSQRLSLHHLKYAVLGLLFLLSGLCLTQERWTAFCLLLSPCMRYWALSALLLPAGFLLGLPFPVGMRLLLSASAQRAHAWAANGCASVITAAAAAQIAISVGLPYLLGGAILAYTAALLAFRHRK